MSDEFDAFIAQHHILTLATCNANMPQCATLFFAYDALHRAFIVASDEKTEHIQNLLANPNVAGTIALETKTLGKIQGIQFRGTMQRSDASEDAATYFSAFPYARVMQPTLWKIVPESMKLTDNRLGFGSKKHWKREDH